MVLLSTLKFVLPLLTIGVMAATIMQILDSTIANVALPHMQASLSATSDTVTWVLTSYIVASAVAIVSPWVTPTRTTNPTPISPTTTATRSASTGRKS